MHVKNPGLWTCSLPVALALLAPFNLLASLGMDIYLPAVPAMPGILATTPAIVQLTLTLYMIMLGIGQVLFGPLSDRIGRRPVLLGGALFFAMASFGLAATSSAFLFLVLRLIQAIAASALLVAVFSTIRDVYAGKGESATVYSLMNAMLAFVPALGPIAGALILSTFGWRGVFVALGLPAIAMLAVALPKWVETRPIRRGAREAGFSQVLTSQAFWTYTFAFGTAMGAFFVFFSTAPRVLIGQAGLTEMEFSLAFATVALVMIATARFVKQFVQRWGTRGSVARGTILLLFGAGLLVLGQIYLSPSFTSFIFPMWLIAIGIVLMTSVTANGALQEFDAIAGTAVALHFCFQSIIVGVIGTSFVVFFDGDTAWPLISYVTAMAAITLTALLCIGDHYPRT